MNPDTLFILLGAGGVPPGATTSELNTLAYEHGRCASRSNDPDTEAMHLRWQFLCWDIADTKMGAR